MEPIEVGFELVKIGVSIAGALGVAVYWNRKKHLADQYKYLDETYRDLLEAYFEHPKFGDPILTAAYTTAFLGEDQLRYKQFAMRVHTFTETIFDIYGTRIPEEWIHIFTYHSGLHASWLADNRAMHEPAYVDLALRHAGSAGSAGARTTRDEPRRDQAARG